MNMMTAITAPTSTPDPWQEQLSVWRRLWDACNAHPIHRTLPSSAEHAALEPEFDNLSDALIKIESRLLLTAAPDFAALLGKMEVWETTFVWDRDDVPTYFAALRSDVERLSTASTDLAPRASPVPVGAAAAAFMRAFQGYRSTWAGDQPTMSLSEIDDQFAHYAWGGATEMIQHAYIDDHHGAAAVALAAYEDLTSFLGDGSRSDRDPIDDENLRRIAAALQNLWRWADRCGGIAARPYAEWARVVTPSDLIRWDRAART